MDIARGSQYAPGWEATGAQHGYLRVHRFGLLAHDVGTGLNPAGVPDHSVHDHISMDARAQSLVPVLLLILRAEQRRHRVVEPLP